ncbi:efflux RND transporter permease subunit [Puniceicoccaceae bacterium K14]|nr:efflux RND transporter permease subunit [Puniceicoccaceae bacterium K14]
MKSKSFTEIFIRRPVLALVVNVVIVIAGLQAMKNLNVRQYPENENAAVKITTAYIGADADLVRGFITTPLERAVASADGVDYVESQSTQGLSTITVRLKLNFDGTKALSEISSKVDQVRGDLPPSAEVPIINLESADSEFASAYLSFTSDILKQNEITDYLLRVVQPRLSTLEGVQRADILGARTFAARIWLKPEKMAALNISPSQARAAIGANNFLSAPGTTKGALVQVNLTTNTDLKSIEEFRKLVVKEVDGDVVRLEDIADVVLGSEDYSTEVRYSGQTATFMGIWPQPNANAIDVISLVKEEMVKVNEEMPEGLKGMVSYDATEYINSAIGEVTSTLLETLLIVVVVIFLFLGSLRSVLVPVVAIPISLIGGVFLIQAFGFSINLLTLLAIVLAVGLVVDDAIVIVENVDRNLSLGKSPMDAAILGVKELVGPVIATTITLAAVYAPIGFQGGLTGSLFREFAFTLTGAVVISTVVALTLSPVMSAKLLKPGANKRGLSGLINRGFEKLKGMYNTALSGTLAYRPLVYICWIILSLLTIPMFLTSPRELAPAEDQGVIFGIVDTAANASLEQTSVSASAINEAFHSAPETEFTFQITSSNFGFGGMVLSEWGSRDRTVFDILPEMQQKVSAIPGVDSFLITPPALPGGSNFPVEIIIASTADTEEILPLAQQLLGKAMQNPLFYFGAIDVKIDQPQAEIVVDREKASSMGLDMQTVGNDLSAMLGGGYVNRFNIDGRSYKVIPQIKRMDRLNAEQLTSIYVTGPDGKLIPLSSIAEIERSTVPRSLNRFQQLNAVKISAMAGPGTIDAALTFLEEEAAKILPDGFVIDYTGESRQLRREGNTFLPALGLASVLIFLVLAAQFNSFRDPFVIILGSVPLAIFGALIFTFLKMLDPNVPFFTDGWTTTLNIYSQVGLVTLVGLVSKNGILIVEFANELQREGMSKLDAVKEAAATRLRPILMTSFATVLGHFPLTLVAGAGAEARNSIGLVLVGGMAIGTLFTLFVVPPIYMLIAKDHSKDGSTQSEAEMPVKALS